MVVIFICLISCLMSCRKVSYCYRTWTPTPRNFIGLEGVFEKFYDKKISIKISGKDEQDGFVPKLKYLTHAFSVNVTCLKYKNNKLSGKVRLGELKVSLALVFLAIWNLKRLLLLVAMTGYLTYKIFAPSDYIIIIWLSDLFKGVVGGVVGITHMKYDWLFGLFLGSFVFGVIALVLVSCLSYKYYFLNRDKLSSIKANELDAEFEINENGLTSIIITYSSESDISISEKDIQQYARHVHHKLCLILELHRNIFHKIQEDNLLIPQLTIGAKVSADGDEVLESDRRSDFLRNMYIVLESSRLGKSYEDYIGSLGMLEYIRVFKKIFSSIPLTDDEAIESEQKIFKYKARFEEAKRRDDLEKIEKEENELHRQANMLFKVVGMILAGLVILEIFAGVKNKSKYEVFIYLEKAMYQIFEWANISAQPSLLTTAIFIGVGVFLIFWFTKAVYKIRLCVWGGYTWARAFWLFFYVNLARGLKTEKYLKYQDRYKKTERYTRSVLTDVLSVQNGSDEKIVTEEEDTTQEEKLSKVEFVAVLIYIIIEEKEAAKKEVARIKIRISIIVLFFIATILFAVAGLIKVADINCFVMKSESAMQANILVFNVLGLDEKLIKSIEESEQGEKFKDKELRKWLNNEVGKLRNISLCKDDGASKDANPGIYFIISNSSIINYKYYFYIVPEFVNYIESYSGDSIMK